MAWNPSATSLDPLNERRSATVAISVSFGAVNVQRETEPSLQLNEPKPAG